MRRPPVYIVEKGKKIGMNLGFIYWGETSFTKVMFKIIIEKHSLNFWGDILALFRVSKSITIYRVG